MALCRLMADYIPQNTQIHVLTVDHGLRAESAEEVAFVKDNLPAHDNIVHKILTWSHDEMPTTRIQEDARFARYALMQNYMKQHDITCLFLGHHMDDQAETFLFRLAKGSGLDGTIGHGKCTKYGTGFYVLPPVAWICEGRVD